MGEVFCVDGIADSCAREGEMEKGAHDGVDGEDAVGIGVHIADEILVRECGEIEEGEKGVCES